IRLCYQRLLLDVVVLLEFFRRDISAGGVEPLAVVPRDPFHGSEGDIPDAVPRAVAVDELFLVKAVYRFRYGIIIGIALAPHGADRADITQPLSIADRGILNAPVRMMNELIPDLIPRRPDRHLPPIQSKLTP